jgi:hypothetical protein
MIRGERKKKGQEKGDINNCGWSRIMKRERETKDKRKGTLIIVDGAE